jgi:hypothetical protein
MEAAESRAAAGDYDIGAVATNALGIGGYIAYVGGHIRHKELRFEQAPELRTIHPP